MGAYGSPETYPFRNPNGKPPRYDSDEPRKCPIWKRWWFWVCLALGALFLSFGGTDQQNMLSLGVIYSVFAFAYNAVRLIARFIVGAPLRPAIKLIGLSVMLFFGCSMALGLTVKAGADNPIKPQIMQTVPTRNMYNSLHQGITYEQACQVMGNDGVLYHEEGFEGQGNAVKAYYWGTKETNVYAGFLSGNLYIKGQTGLQ